MLACSVMLAVGSALCAPIAFPWAPTFGTCVEHKQAVKPIALGLRLTRKLAMQAVQSAPQGAAPPIPLPGFAGGVAEPAAKQYQQGGVPLPQWQPQQLPQQLLQQQVRSLPNDH